MVWLIRLSYKMHAAIVVAMGYVLYTCMHTKIFHLGIYKVSSRMIKFRRVYRAGPKLVQLDRHLD